MTPRKTIAGLSATAIIMGGVDASVLNETPIERVEMVANERVEARQLGDVVETTLPWKGEEGLKIKYDLGEPTILERFNDKRKQEVITEVVDFEDGGFKVDILLNEKPDTNKFCYAIEGAENYDFFYQPPLTVQEIAQGKYRPEEIVGSYAVYHKELRDHIDGQENYGIGKPWHIPRPQVWEVNNPASTTIWADLSFDEKKSEICVTVDQNYLDVANYPVRVDPTWGYTSAGASLFAFVFKVSPTSFASRRLGNSSTSTSSGTLDSISAYLSSNATSTVDIFAALNEVDSIATNSHGEIFSTENASSTITTTAAWNTFTASGESITAGTEYVLNVSGNSLNLPTVVELVYLHYDNTGTQDRFLETFTNADAETAYSNSQEDPWTEVPNSDNDLFSIYATYTETPPEPKGSQVYINKGTVKVENGKLIID